MKLVNRALAYFSHESQNGNMTYTKKNGSQHNTNTPIMIAIVRAALRSFAIERLCLRSRRFSMCMLGGSGTLSPESTAFSESVYITVRSFACSDCSFVSFALDLLSFQQDNIWRHQQHASLPQPDDSDITWHSVVGRSARARRRFRVAMNMLA